MEITAGTARQPQGGPEPWTEVGLGEKRPSRAGGAVTRAATREGRRPAIPLVGRDPRGLKTSFPHTREHTSVTAAGFLTARTENDGRMKVEYYLPVTKEWSPIHPTTNLESKLSSGSQRQKTPCDTTRCPRSVGNRQLGRRGQPGTGGRPLSGTGTLSPWVGKLF